MHIDDFLKLVKERRSIRKFKPDPIPDEYVEMEKGGDYTPQFGRKRGDSQN